jgi:malonyl-CoA O-methyltransferase
MRREVAARMQERLALVKLSPQQVLDAGCGAGSDLLALQKRFVDAQVIGLDASPAMLESARQARHAALSSLNKFVAQWLPPTLQPTAGLRDGLLCGDFAQIPLAAQSVDLVWSNLALHWHPSPDRVFAEWRRVIRTDGLLMFSCFGPDSLKEIRSAFAAIDQTPHVLPFVDMHDFGDMLVDAGFSTPVMDMETITVTYRSVENMLAEVRAFGGNPLATARRGLIGKAAWQRGVAQLQQLARPDGTLPLTFEVIYGHAFRPAPKVTARGESIVRLDFPKKK